MGRRDAKRVKNLSGMGQLIMDINPQLLNITSNSNSIIKTDNNALVNDKKYFLYFRTDIKPILIKPIK